MKNELHPSGEIDGGDFLLSIIHREKMFWQLKY